MKILITGGAGFIGINAAAFLMKNGNEISILDNLSRKGSKTNLEWLKKQGSFIFYKADISKINKVNEIIKNGEFDAIIHLAAQVAVTTSVINPRNDFNTNAIGTFNLLEAVRLFSSDTAFLYASTNKVYGALQQFELKESKSRYILSDPPEGIPESTSLNFYSPYGCSKGTADQYVLDYFKMYGIKTTVFRQSCIYGPRQFGVEDQGWVAWFIIAHLLEREISIYGNGKQVRDLLYVEDLVQLYADAIGNINKVKGLAFNIGGGKGNTISVLEFMEWLSKKSGKEVNFSFDNWRPGDQLIFISDNQKIKEKLGWEPKTGFMNGLDLLYKWVLENKEEIRKFQT